MTNHTHPAISAMPPLTNGATALKEAARPLFAPLFRDLEQLRDVLGLPHILDEQRAENLKLVAENEGLRAQIASLTSTLDAIAKRTAGEAGSPIPPPATLAGEPAPVPPEIKPIEARTSTTTGGAEARNKGGRPPNEALRVYLKTRPDLWRKLGTSKVNPAR